MMDYSNQDFETKEKNSLGDKRLEKRYRSVGVALLFSPSVQTCVPGFGQILFQASVYDISLQGLSFDVTEPISVGGELIVRVQQPDDWLENLYTNVCWCNPLESGGYRVGVNIKSIDLIHKSELDVDWPEMSIAQDQADMPASLEMICPACLKGATFSLVALQPLCASSEGLMPLYNCSSCATTRSLTGLFCFNRKS